MTSRHGIRALAPVLLALTLGIPAVAAAQIDEPVIPLQTRQSELYRFRIEYALDFNNHNAAALAALYSPDAIVIAGNGNGITGTEQIRQFLTQSLATTPNITLASDSLAIYGNTAIDYGTLTARPAAGGEQVSRYLAVLRRDHDGWKVIRVSSTPVTEM